MLSDPHLCLARFQTLMVEAACFDCEPFFMGLPDRWYEPPTYRCTKGHISHRYLKTDEGKRCLACFEPLALTFPEDTETTE